MIAGICLQGDIEKAARRKIKKGGQPILRRPGFLKDLIEWVLFSAWLPDDNEFHYFWTHILERMEGALAGDFNEPLFAMYLRKNIFIIKNGLITAQWRSGLGSVPLGFTTYAPNAAEVSIHIPFSFFLSLSESFCF